MKHHVFGLTNGQSTRISQHTKKIIEIKLSVGGMTGSTKLHAIEILEGKRGFVKVRTVSGDEVSVNEAYIISTRNKILVTQIFNLKGNTIKREGIIGINDTVEFVDNFTNMEKGLPVLD